MRCLLLLVLLFISPGIKAASCHLPELRSSSQLTCSQDKGNLSALSKNLYRQSCYKECQEYLKGVDSKDPACASAADASGICIHSFDQVKEYLSNPQNILNLATACFVGKVEGVEGAVENLKGYAKLIGTLASESAQFAKGLPPALQRLDQRLAQNAKTQSNWQNQCAKSTQCRVGLARMLPEYATRESSGKFQLSDSEVFKKIERIPFPIFLASVKNAKAERKKLCDTALGDVAAKMLGKTYPTSYERQMDRYRLLSERDPICIGLLQLTPPVRTSTPQQPVKGFLESLNIKPQCYSPAKMQELLCLEATKFILDPLNLVGMGTGGLAAKALAKAGLKKVAADIIEREVATTSLQGLTIAKVQGESARKALLLTNSALSNDQRIQAAAKILNRDLSENQQQALLKAHKVGLGEVGKNGQAAAIENYTQAQLSQKYRLLKEAGYSEQEARSLMENGLAGTSASEGAAALEAQKLAFVRSQISRHLKPDADPFETLGMPRNASVQEMKARYKELAKSLHPDKLPKTLSAAERAQADFLFKKINEANGILNDPKKLAELRGKLTSSANSASSGPAPSAASPSTQPQDWFRGGSPPPSHISIQDYAYVNRNMLEKNPQQFVQKMGDLAGYVPQTGAGASKQAEVFMTGLSSPRREVADAALRNFNQAVLTIAKMTGPSADPIKAGYLNEILEAYGRAPASNKARVLQAAERAVQSIGAESHQTATLKARESLLQLLKQNQKVERSTGQMMQAPLKK